MAAERDVLAEALHKAVVRMRAANVSEGTMQLCLAIIQSELDAARGYTLTRSAPDTPPDGLQPDGHTIVHVAACEGCFGPGGYRPPETVLDDLTEPVPVDMTGVPRREPAGSEPGQGAVTGSVSVAPLCGFVMATCWNEPAHRGDHWNPAIALAAQPSAEPGLDGRAVHAAWRDGMLAQYREVTRERMAWDTLSEKDRQLDDIIARKLSAPPEPLDVAHEPDEPHRYRIECTVCGQRGVVRLSVDPERSEPAAALTPDRPTRGGAT